MTRHRTHDEYVAGAFAALRQHGPVSDGRAVSVSGAMRALGRPRAAAYRSWASAGQLAEELSLRAAGHRDGWQTRLLRQDPAIGIEAAVTAALGGPAELGVAERAAFAARSAGPGLRLVEVRRERDWLRSCAAWLADRGAGLGRADWDLVAVGLSSLIEGTLIVRSLTGTGPPVGDPADRRLAASAGRLVAELVASTEPPPSARPDAPATDPHAVALDDDRSATLDQLIGLLGDGDGPVARPTRLVDLSRLGRRMGVSPRRLYAVWPTTADLNGDLVTRAVRAHRATVDRIERATVVTAAAEGHGPSAALYVAALRTIVEGSGLDEARAIFACAHAVAEPAVRSRVHAELAAAQVDQKVALLALLQLTGAGFRSGSSPRQHSDAAFATTLGAQRLAATHADLRDWSVTYRGLDQPALATVVYGLLASATERVRAQPGGRPS